MNDSLYLWLIPVLPLIGAAANGLLGRGFTKRVVAAVALVFSGAAFAQALWVASRFGSLSQVPYQEHLFPWIRAGAFMVEFGFYLDQLSLIMILIVTGVGFLIHVYSVAYMEHEGGYYRFFAYLNLFMFFMLTLVLANNYLLMFVGWEGVGLASYLLIGFFFLKDSAANAGKKAFIVNRIGDAAFLLGMFMMVRAFGSLRYDEVFGAVAQAPVDMAGAGALTIIGVLLMIGATGKSAQVPLYVWLPDAMEGPTPVSALIHAATMVTAGIYMIARSNPIYSKSPTALLIIAVIGALTAFLAATIGTTQFDIKRVLAYSTVSQLGYMMLALGVAAYTAAIFHLMTHAFFKALLFLCSGSVIHALGGEQDMRRMGGLRKLIPWTFWTMAIGTVAIAGMPPLAGFFSKDEILWKAWGFHPVFWAVGIVTAFLTSFYMFRLLFMTFFGERRLGAIGEGEEAHAHASAHAAHAHGPAEHAHGASVHVPAPVQAPAAAHEAHAHSDGNVHESPWMMLAPLVILAVLSVVGGWVGIPHSLGGHNYFEEFLRPVVHGTTSEGTESSSASAHEDTSMELMLTGISVLVALAGMGLAWLMYVKRRDLPGRVREALGGLYTAVYNKYFVDEMYDTAVVQPIKRGSEVVLWQGVDVGTIDTAVNGTAVVWRGIGGTLRRMQSGNIRSYAGWVAAGAALVVGYMVWMGVAR